MANVPVGSLLVVALRFALSFAASSDIVYYFPLDSTTVSGVLKDGSCTNLSTSTIQGSSPGTVEGPDTTQSDTALNLAADNWVSLGDFRDTCISNPALCPNGMSVAFWIRLDASGSGDRHIINTGKLDTSRGIQVFYTNSHTNVVICDGTKRYPVEIDFPGHWTHVVAVYDPSGATAADRFYVYVNGTQKETARYESNCMFADTDTSLLVGHDSASSLTSGRQLAISQLAFFFRTLNQTEVQQMYSNPTSGIQLNCPAPTSTTATTGSNTIIAAGATSSSINPSTGLPGSGSGSGQTQDDKGKGRSPTVLILLSVSLFVLLVIVIIIIIGCCIIVPSAKEKGYKCL